MKFSIFGGTTKTPKGAGLCETCRNGHVVRGESVSDVQVRCYYVGTPSFEIKRPVCECSNYVRIGQLMEQELEKSAWIFKDDGHGHLKFVPPG